MCWSPANGIRSRHWQCCRRVRRHQWSRSRGTRRRRPPVGRRTFPPARRGDPAAFECTSVGRQPPLQLACQLREPTSKRGLPYRCGRPVRPRLTADRALPARFVLRAPPILMADREPSFSTKSASYRRRPRLRSCGCCRSVSSSESAARRQFAPTCASSQRPIATSRRPSRQAPSGATSTIASRPACGGWGAHPTDLRSLAAGAERERCPVHPARWPSAVGLRDRDQAALLVGVPVTTRRPAC